MMEYLEWIEKCKEEERKAHDLVKSMAKSEYERFRFPNQFSFDEGEFFSLQNRLRENTEVYEYRAFMRYEKHMVEVQYPDDEEVEEWNGQIEECPIETFRLASVRELREKLGMTQKIFGDYLGIPKRSIQNWENEVTACPEYVLIFISEKIYRDFYKKEWE